MGLIMYAEEPGTTTNSADFAEVARTLPGSPTDAEEEKRSGAEAAAGAAAAALPVAGKATVTIYTIRIIRSCV